MNVTFFPDWSDDILLMTLEMPSGTPWHETQRTLNKIEEIASNLNQDYASIDAILARHLFEDIRTAEDIRLRLSCNLYNHAKAHPKILHNPKLFQ